ncbi:Pyridoxine/pyridoxamine 5'-phosphate oxidase [Actinidia chinensis var. chinensis]|uniref:Pyridoxine/pyridoxamine 5'-phosphate oxidase n=1 Tax=Actinidia chinensis var. chinensis TaxID=1590841 RepID=A0A2R6PCP3_ACTCC|nr:Pyridoxine/pyridoxamine 5'-phosphate oxidase [Actinidia chinensis var. chinensis]
MNKDTMEYFTLGDMWEFYNEWSAYGVGTPVVLNDGDTLVQYYVPYLSAIQIYTNKSSPSLIRSTREDNDVGECEVEFWSDDSESDKLSRSLSNNSSKGWDATSLDSSVDHEASWTMRDRLGHLYFQYYETCSPYWRIPLVDRITEFAHNYPGLGTLKSVDLSPASWMAIAWYPIYHIPTKGNVKDLSTCFLTFHTLSSSFQDTTADDDSDVGKDIHCSEVVDEILGGKSKTKGSGEIYLPPFGLATYKMQGNLWINPEASDHERLIYLHSAADSWLKQLNVQHHDFMFYTSHTSSIDAAGMPAL